MIISKRVLSGYGKRKKLMEKQYKLSKLPKISDFKMIKPYLFDLFFALLLPIVSIILPLYLWFHLQKGFLSLSYTSVYIFIYFAITEDRSGIYYSILQLLGI